MGELSSFNPSEEGLTSIVIEIVIHMVFIFSALLLAHTEKTLHSYPHGNHQHSSDEEGEGNDHGH